MRRLATKQHCDREVAVDMLPCCRRGAGVAGAAHHDHDGYSDAPGRPVSYPTVALFHVSLTLRKILKRRAAESPTSRSACLLVSRIVLTHPQTHFGLTKAKSESRVDASGGTPLNPEVDGPGWSSRVDAGGRVASYNQLA